MVMQIIVFSFLIALGVGILVILIQWAVASHLRKKMFEQEKRFFEQEKKALKNQQVEKRNRKK